MEPVSPQPSSQSPPTFAGGILLTVVGGMTFLLFLLVVMGSLFSGDFEDNVVYGVIAIAVVLFGAAEVWVGILAIAGRPGGRTAGIAVSVAGIALAIAGIVDAIVLEESYIGVVVSGMIMAASIVAIVLLARARPPA